MKNTQQDFFSQAMLFPEAQMGPVLSEDSRADGDEESSLKSWSYSRRECFEKCPRLYYYTYYGGTARLAKTDTQKPVLRFLKKVSNRHLRAGDIMHWAISCTLRARAKGREWSPSFLVEFAGKRFQEDIAFPNGFKEGDTLPEKSAGPVLLMELHHRLAGAKEMCSTVQDKLVKALQNFQGAAYGAFRAGVDGGQAKIECPVSVKHQGISLRGKVDLAFPQNGRVSVVDWKMGNGEGGDDSLQLLFYAIWAMQAFNCDVNRIDLFKAYLGSGDVIQFDFNPKAILRAKARIVQDMERMRAIDDFGRNGVVEAFTPCAQEKVCAGCVYQRICPKE